MTTMISEVYEAFKAAQVSEEQARAAAEAVAKINDRYAFADNKIDKLENTLQREISKVSERLAGVEGRLSSIQWLLGGVIAAIGVQIVVTLMK